MYAIEALGLTKRFGSLTAVDHVDFEVEWGEVFGFLGPNGAGKTTTINMLITLMRPSEGTARVAGFDVVSSPREVRRRIGVVFQDPTLDRRLTGRENLWLHGRIYGIPSRKLKNRIEEMLEFVELTDWADTLVKYYSGGMMRRLEIARAFLYSPEILFLDEPTLGLDPQTRFHLWSYIRKLRDEEGITIFLTTHYMEEAERLCDRIAIIDYGRIIASGNTQELRRLVGGDIVYVKTRGDGEAFAELLRREALADSVHVYHDGTIAVATKRAPEAIPRIFRKARELGIDIDEITYHSPTLEDVFLRLTGRRLRDEKASFFDHVRMRMRPRGGAPHR